MRVLLLVLLVLGAVAAALQPRSPLPSLPSADTPCRLRGGMRSARAAAFQLRGGDTERQPGRVAYSQAPGVKAMRMWLRVSCFAAQLIVSFFIYFGLAIVQHDLNQWWGAVEYSTVVLISLWLAVVVTSLPRMCRPACFREALNEIRVEEHRRPRSTCLLRPIDISHFLYWFHYGDGYQVLLLCSGIQRIHKIQRIADLIHKKMKIIPWDFSLTECDDCPLGTTDAHTHNKPPVARPSKTTKETTDEPRFDGGGAPARNVDPRASSEPGPTRDVVRKLRSLSTKQLRAMLHAHGKECRTCVEKDDLVGRVLAVIEKA